MSISRSASLLLSTSALSEEQRGYQELARKFAKEEMIPVAPEYDRTGEVSPPSYENGDPESP